jgi:ATP-dependent Clp protease ATP-binding subunit ClpC
VPVFERFTDEARRVIVLSQEESRLLNHDYIGTEHVLLALVADPESPMTQLLAVAKVTDRRVRHELVEIVGRGSLPPSGHMPFTPQAKQVVELAVRQALELRHEHIEPAHLLYGVLAVERGLAARILVTLGSDLDQLRQEVLRVLAQTQHQRGWTP